MPFKIVPRDQWGSLPITTAGEPLEHPMMWVNLAHLCLDYKVPSEEIVLELQRQDLLTGRSDIQPNFLIAEDGVVFEGRGWFIQPGNAMDHVGKEGQFLDITFMGNLDKVSDNMQHPMYQSLKKLLSIGVNNNYLSGEGRFLQAEDEDESPRRLGFHGMPLHLLGLLPPAECTEDVKRPGLNEGRFGSE